MSLNPVSHYIQNLIWHEPDLNVKAKTLNFLEENGRGKLHNSKVGKDLLDKITGKRGNDLHQ